jgi:hypothetical protein
MCSEFDALQRNGTWSLVPLTPNLNVLSNKWVYKIKHRSDDSIELFKACLVANGFHQQPGLDYNETFSAMVKHTTIRTVLALATSKCWSIHQLDIHNAFLHGHLTEKVYMHQPHGFEDPTFPYHVCRLHKSLYGLKQAPSAWFQIFSDYLEDLGFLASQADPSLFIYRHNNIFVCLHKSLYGLKQAPPAWFQIFSDYLEDLGFLASQVDPSLFIYCHNNIFVYLLIYVDDILITGNDASHISYLIQQFGSLFAMKDRGQLHYFLGIEASYQGTSLYLT